MKNGIFLLCLAVVCATAPDLCRAAVRAGLGPAAPELLGIPPLGVGWADALADYKAGGRAGGHSGGPVVDRGALPDAAVGAGVGVGLGVGLGAGPGEGVPDLLIPARGAAPDGAAVPGALPPLLDPAAEPPIAEVPVSRLYGDAESGLLGFHLSLTATGVLFGVAPYLSDAGWTRPLELSGFDAGGLNSMDRWVVGQRSRTAAAVSDALLATQMSLPYLALAAESLLTSDADLRARWGRDTLVMTEAMATTFLLVNLTKFSVRRPRPFNYHPATTPGERLETEATLSFFSGHAALAFTMATSYSYLFTKRHPDSPLVVPMWVTTHALASTTAVMRVLAGKHFWSDVLVGAAVGTGVGLFVPWLHDQIDGGGHDPNSLWANLRIMPTMVDGGMGVAVLYTW